MSNSNSNELKQTPEQPTLKVEAQAGSVEERSKQLLNEAVGAIREAKTADGAVATPEKTVVADTTVKKTEAKKEQAGDAEGETKEAKTEKTADEIPERTWEAVNRKEKEAREAVAKVKEFEGRFKQMETEREHYKRRHEG